MSKDTNNGEVQMKNSTNLSSHRPSYRLDFNQSKTPNISPNNPDKGCDSISQREITIAAPAGVEKKMARISRVKLEKIEEELSARDMQVLEAIAKYRLLTSDQVGRLFFYNCTTKTSRTRNQNLLLKRLAGLGLIRPLERRIGGVNGGSSVQIWHLTEAGHRLLTLNTPSAHKRKRFTEPSPLFLKHTLAIAECVVQLTQICRNSYDLNLEAVDTEPSCWRKFKADGQVNYLKPDIFVKTSYDKYEDNWFIEVDLGTESAAQIVEKCNTYLEYYYSGIEQKESSVFPIVTWLAINTARKERIRQYIKENIKGQPKMFLVITPDELERMLRQDMEAKELL